MSPAEFDTLMERYYKQYGRMGAKMALCLQGYTDQYQNKYVAAMKGARRIFGEFSVDYEALEKYYRKKAKNKGDPTRMTRLKRHDTRADLEAIRNSNKETKEEGDNND